MNFLLKYMSVRVGLLPLCKPYRELHFENSLLDTLLRYRCEALEVTKPLYIGVLVFIIVALYFFTQHFK